MEELLPAVVAVVVTTGSAPGLEATVASLVAQDYPELSTLVVVNGEPEDIPSRVAAISPSIFLHQIEINRGFAAACNEAAVITEGATYYLFCHDDVALKPTCVTRLVEAALRTNAGIVTPKIVDYNDPLVLVHVGQTSDRFGAVRDRIEEGEIDHGQQDLERDVFVAPGGVTLVRADLFTTLRGFDPLMPSLGEDLDLCWRAQVAGARIIVAPLAIARHRQSLARGERSITAVGTKGLSRQDLQRRHQLFTVLSGWGWRYGPTTIMMLVLLDVVEFGISIVGRDTDRAGAIIGSWRWNLIHLRRLRQRRRDLAEIRVLSDKDLHRLMVPGASRLRQFFITVLREGYDRARGVLPHDFGDELVEGDQTGVGFGVAFSESDEFDEIAESEGLIARRKPSRWLTSFRSQAILVSLFAIGWFIGARNLVATHLPFIGRLLPLDSWWSNWRHFFASWAPNGVGTGTPGMPGYGILGFAGTFVFGRMGVLPRLALILAVPVGVIGISRMLRQRVSNRSRVLALVATIGFPVGLNAIANGRIDLLVLIALLPFIVRRLFDQLEVPLFRLGQFGDYVPFGHRGWRTTMLGQRMVLVMLVALAGAFVPAVAVDVGIVIVAVSLARWWNSEPAQGVRPWALLGSVLGNVAVFLLPLTLDTLFAGRRALAVFGVARAPWEAPNIGQIFKLVDGSHGVGWVGWLVPIVAIVGYGLARDIRRSAANIVMLIYFLSVAVAEASLRHWMGPFTPDPDALLALGAVAVALLVALGVSAIENDVRSSKLSWRQPAAILAVLSLALSFAPEVAAFGSGRFDMPAASVAESLAQLAPYQSGYRVLWLGDPSVLPTSGWGVAPGLELATSTNGLPSGSELFTPPDSSTSDVLINAVKRALAGQTVNLGKLLAPAGIATIVVVSSSSPTLAGVSSGQLAPPPAGLTLALNAQSDLALELQTPDVAIYGNGAFAGLVRAKNPATGVVSAAFTDQGNQGLVQPGLVYSAGLAPAGAWALEINGKAATRLTHGTWYPHFTSSITTTQSGELVMHQFPWNGLIALFTLGLWIVVWLGFGTLQRLETVTTPKAGRGRHARTS